MLEITIPATELWDEVKNEFVNSKEQTLKLEHSLISVSKWESKWHKPFLGDKQKTREETIDYIKCMTLNSNVDENTYEYLSNENIQRINSYIEDPMTATTFRKEDSKISREIVTAEVIYWQMIALNVPFECQKWHLNRLLTLLKVCNVKNQPAKKMSAADQKALMKARRAKARPKGR